MDVEKSELAGCAERQYVEVWIYLEEVDFANVYRQLHSLAILVEGIQVALICVNDEGLLLKVDV